MDRLMLYFLLFGLWCYLVGFVFSKRIHFYLFHLLKHPSRIKSFVRSWLDYLFVFVIAIPSLLLTIWYFWPKPEQFPRSDTIQLLIFLATFLTLFYSVLIKDGPSKFRNRPRIKALFDPKGTDHYHRTTMNVFAEGNGVRRLIASIPTHYIRLKVKNEGEKTLKNVEVVLEDVEPRPLKPFMSLNLSWAGFNLPPNDIKRSVDIPRGQSRTLDVFEFMEFASTRILADQLSESRDPDSKRYEELSEGFRSCTIKPLTRSDIYSRGLYTFKLGIYADGVEPTFLKLKVNYTGNWIEKTTDEEMRLRHLQVDAIS